MSVKKSLNSKPQLNYKFWGMRHIFSGMKLFGSFLKKLTLK